MICATVFNVQRFSLHDGPGIRTTVFLKGCPLRCVWCHNPESFDPRPEPSIAASRCIACGSCVRVCEHHLTGPVAPDSVENRPAQHPENRCTRCGACAEACPTETRQMLGRRTTVEDLLDELDRDRLYHEESSGGVTFSGGEPLSASNAPFVIACLRRLSEQGVNTAVDTCGHVPAETLAHAAELADLFLFDLKIMDPEAHRRATGQDNALILRNLNWLVGEGHDVRLRMPLVPGWNDAPENLQKAAEYVRGLKTRGQVPEIYLLPFHGIARDKYQRLGRFNPMAQVSPLSDDEVATRARILKEHGLTVHIGG